MKRASSSSWSNSARWASGTFARSASRRLVKSPWRSALSAAPKIAPTSISGISSAYLSRDVVARDEAVGDLVEIRLQRLADALCRFQIVQDLLRRAPADAVRGDAARGERGAQAFERRGADAARDRRGALEHAEHLARGQARPALHFRHEVADGKAARNREDVVPVDHLGRVGPDLVEVREELRVAERRDGRVLELAVARDRIRLDLLVPAAHVLAPELLREDPGSGRDAAADLRVQPRQQHEDQAGRRARRACPARRPARTSRSRSR